ncbi:MAG: hypothetical protein LBD38_01700 [Streptococcaceae bacterium]|jgi:hypothetical protein|nr:hypothetical protein [Streptococcaceae bacterium]
MDKMKNARILKEIQYTFDKNQLVFATEEIAKTLGLTVEETNKAIEALRERDQLCVEYIPENLRGMLVSEKQGMNYSYMEAITSKGKDLLKEQKVD